MPVILFCLMSAMVVGAIAREDYKNGLKFGSICGGVYAVGFILVAVMY